MWRPLLLLILNLLITPVWAFDQTNAGDYFHRGVQYYIFGEKTNAVREIYTGLQTYPTDQLLNAAYKLVQKKESEDKNNSKSKQQNQKQDQDKKDQKDQKQQQKQDQKSEQQKKEEEKAKQEQAKKDKEKKEQQAQQASEQAQKDKQNETAEQAAAELHMSPQEARQLLESLKDDSKVLLFSPTNQPVKRQPGKFKDW